MTTNLTLRSVKGSPLTNAEIDGNFTALQQTADGAAPLVHTHTANQISDSTAAGRTLLTSADVAAQRGALGLGNTATLNIGTTTGTVAAGDDARITTAVSGINSPADALSAADGLQVLQGASWLRSNFSAVLTYIRSAIASATDAFQLPSGTTAQRPSSPNNGMRRYNTDNNREEFYAAGGWRNHARLDGDIFSGRLAVAQVALTDASVINTDASLGNVFTVTLGGARTLANPTNLQAGTWLAWRVVQDANGSRTLAFGNAFRWLGRTAPTLTTASNAVDWIIGYTDGTTIQAVFLGDFG